MNEATQVSAGAAKQGLGNDTAPQEFLTFTLGNEEYGNQRMPILVDVEKLMTGSDMALMDAAH